MSINQHQFKINEITVTRLETILGRKILRGGDQAINEALDKLEGGKKTCR